MTLPKGVTTFPSQFLLPLTSLTCTILTCLTRETVRDCPYLDRQRTTDNFILFSPPIVLEWHEDSTMTERISRLKAKLLGRLSPKADADPSAHFNRKPPSSPLDSNKSPAYSIASSKHLDVIGSSRSHQVQEPLSPGTNPELGSSVSAPSEPPHTGTRNCTPSTEPYNSSLPTPISGDLPSPLETPPLSTPQHSDTTSFQSTHLKAQTPILPETPLTPTLHTVAEWPTNDHQPSTSYFPPSSKRPSLAIRRQSLLPATHNHLISGLLDASVFSSGDQASGFTPVVPCEMVTRRVWVKRPGGSATLVPCREDAVVDELRDHVIMKYGNSLGRSFDSPDIAIRILPREGSNRPGHTERLLSPEEVLISILDTYYPGGQNIDEALVIDAPSRRTPKPSPRHSMYQYHHSEPGEHGDYFPLMPPVKANAGTPSAHSGAPSVAANAPSISILNTGVAPLLPSPGSRRARHQRPPLTRHRTNSPTILHNQNTQTPGITGMFSSNFTLFNKATDMYRNWSYSSFPTYPSPCSRNAYTSCGTTAGGISSGEIAHSPGNGITTRDAKNKSSHFSRCYVWRVD